MYLKFSTKNGNFLVLFKVVILLGLNSISAQLFVDSFTSLLKCLYVCTSKFPSRYVERYILQKNYSTLNFGGKKVWKRISFKTRVKTFSPPSKLYSANKRFVTFHKKTAFPPPTQRTVDNKQIYFLLKQQKMLPKKQTHFNLQKTIRNKTRKLLFT